MAHREGETYKERNKRKLRDVYWAKQPAPKRLSLSQLRIQLGALYYSKKGNRADLERRLAAGLAAAQQHDDLSVMAAVSGSATPAPAPAPAPEEEPAPAPAPAPEEEKSGWYAQDPGS